MAVTATSRPLGHKLSPAALTGTLDTDGSGHAIITASVSVVDGSYIYVESNFESYNGFKVVEVTIYGPNIFKIRDYPVSSGEPPTAYIQDADVVFYVSILDHSWQSVHLPIVYQLKTDRYPTNYAFSPVPIDSSSNYNGYTRITSSSTFTDPERLEYISLMGDGDFEGPHQIIEVFAADDIAIDIAYDASVDFTIYEAVPYYNNYFIEVEVYSGLESGHRWEDQKPSELVATLRLIPDSNNMVKFSISEVLKGNIDTRNNLTLDTLPNNLDFYTQFRINWRECYDGVNEDGEIIVNRGALTEDDFIGNAVNSMMPFKSLYQGFMSEYIDIGDGNTVARWLTLFDRPVAIIGYFFDLSFLLIRNGDIKAFIYKISPTTTDLDILEIQDPGTGVIRIPLIPESGYTSYCIQITGEGEEIALNLSDFGNTSTGGDWTLGVTPTRSSSGSSKILYDDYAFVAGTTYQINLTVSHNTGGGTTGNITLAAYTSSDTIVSSTSDPIPIGTGTHNMSLSFVADASTTRVGVRLSSLLIGTLSVTAVSIAPTTVPITEKICIDVIEDCGDTFTNDDLRITEDDLFRQIE